MNTTTTENNIQPIDWEQKGREFLTWVAENEKTLRVAIMKNTTFQRDIFEDIWSTSLLKVYKAIVERHVEIDNLKNYVFTSLKWDYIIRQNQLKRQEQIHVRDYFDCDLRDDVCEPAHDIAEEDNQEEERHNRITEVLNALRAVLTENFGESDTDLYFHYFTAKSNGMTSYSKVADALGIPQREIVEKIKQMKIFVAGHPSFANLKIVL